MSMSEAWRCSHGGMGTSRRRNPVCLRQENSLSNLPNIDSALQKRREKGSTILFSFSVGFQARDYCLGVAFTAVVLFWNRWFRVWLLLFLLCCCRQLPVARGSQKVGRQWKPPAADACPRCWVLLGCQGGGRPTTGSHSRPPGLGLRWWGVAGRGRTAQAQWQRDFGALRATLRPRKPPYAQSASGVMDKTTWLYCCRWP